VNPQWPGVSVVHAHYRHSVGDAHEAPTFGDIAERIHDALPDESSSRKTFASTGDSCRQSFSARQAGGYAGQTLHRQTRPEAAAAPLPQESRSLAWHYEIPIIGRHRAGATRAHRAGSTPHARDARRLDVDTWEQLSAFIKKPKPAPVRSALPQPVVVENIAVTAPAGMPLVQSRRIGKWNVHAIQAAARSWTAVRCSACPQAALGATPGPRRRNRIQLGMRCLLIEHESGLVLIDTGAGEQGKREVLRHYGTESGCRGRTQLEDGLRQLGREPRDISLVINSHLHFDHAAATPRTGDGKNCATFSKARTSFRQVSTSTPHTPTSALRRATSRTTSFRSARAVSSIVTGSRPSCPEYRSADSRTRAAHQGIG